MELKDAYITVCEEVAMGDWRDRGSRFTAFLHHVTTPEEAMESVESYRKRFFDARHHCFAYRLGVEGQLWRAGDDGEPAGTAGRVILGQLVSEGLTDVLVVVVRYFGGVKLGVAGLIAAYRGATVEALGMAVREEKVVRGLWELRFAYTLMGEVTRFLDKWDGEITERIMEADCRWRVAVRLRDGGVFVTEASGIYGVHVTPIPTSSKSQCGEQNRIENI